MRMFKKLSVSGMSKLSGSLTSRKVINLTAVNVNNYNIFNNRGPNYIAGITDIVLTISGYVGSNSTASPSLTSGSGWTTGDTITVINNGNIWGRGGAAGIAGNASNLNPGNGSSQSWPRYAGGAGGLALQALFPMTVVNNGTIASGGKGGSSGECYASRTNNSSGSGTLSTIQGTNGGNGAGYPFNGSSTGSAAPLLSYPYGSQYQGYNGSALGSNTYVSGNALITWSVAGNRLGSIS